MKLSMLFLSFLLTLSGIAQKTAYDFKVSSINGNEIDFNNLHNKILIVVNVASASERTVQLRQLDTLCQRYASEGLVVVAFPSNDFNNEPKTAEEIRSWTAGLHANLLVASKTSVTGEARSAFYSWCTKKSENGMLEADVKGDYQKFIISKEGKVAGVFAGSVSPLAEPFIRAITVNL